MSKGTWVTSGFQPGDILIFDWGKGIAHCGICEGVDDDGRLVTIEGNTAVGNDSNGGSVMRRYRSKSSVVGACRPAYPSNGARQKLLEVARREIGVKETGNNNVKYNTAYYGREVGGSAYPWCVVFVWWCFREAGMAELFYGGGKVASCTALANYYGYQKSSKIGGENTVTLTVPVLKQGDKGAHVRAVQRLLNGHGYNAGSVDGDFGKQTRTAVQQFQLDKKLTVDGIVGEKTWNALLS